MLHNEHKGGYQMEKPGKCAHCGAETQLWNNGVPICGKCGAARAKANPEKDFGRAKNISEPESGS
jgi:hypothetical protein